jgi:hypothetical protein
MAGMRWLTGKLTFANVMSVTAVFIALGGSAVAITQLPKDSVGAKQIKAGAVRSAEVKDFSLRASDFAKDSLPAGTAGPKGEQGPQGPAGPPERPERRRSRPMPSSALEKWEVRSTHRKSRTVTA